MQEYDAILKRVLMRFTPAASAHLTGFAIGRWLNAELPEVRNLRADLLGETTDGRLLHIELQSTNDPEMPRRMLEYAVAIYGQYRRRPEQLVLYAGQAPLKMTGRLADFAFNCRIADFRDFDAEPLLASDGLADNVIAILMRHRDLRAAVRRVLERVAGADPAERGEAMVEVFVLAGLRRIAPLVREEVSKMPILDSIMDHEILGPKLREARAEGEQRGEQRGRQAGERQLLRRQIEKRFGRLPGWAAARLDGMSLDELESAGLRLLDATKLEELLG